MRLSGLLALGLVLATPALAHGGAQPLVTVNCTSPFPDAQTSYSQHFDEGELVGQSFILELDYSGPYIAVTIASSLNVRIVFDGYTVNYAEPPSETLYWGGARRNVMELDTTNPVDLSINCVNSIPQISRLQTTSPFRQRNLASSSTSFRALLEPDDLTDDAPIGPMNFSPDQARATEALDAIEGTFSLLGYGPNALLSGDALLARGEDWRLKGIVKGSFAETDLLPGKLTQTEVTASLLLFGRLDAGLRYALSATSGFGRADAPGQSATSRKLIFDGALALPLDTELDLLVGANWGMTHHDVDLGGANAGYDEQMASASVALRGEQRYGAFTLNPTLAASLGVGIVPDFTDSAAASHLGGTSFIASADAGFKLSYALPSFDDAMQVTPFIAMSLSGYHQSFAETGAAATASNGFGAEMTLGAKADVGAGVSTGLEGTLRRSDTMSSASISGSVSGAF